jgi:pilus assembly protein CpaC
MNSRYLIVNIFSGLLCLMTLICLGGLAYARDVNVNSPQKESSSPVLFQQLFEGTSSFSLDSSQPVTEQLTKIYVTRGRSQILKFAHSVVRLSIADPGLADIIPLSPNEIMINGRLRGVTSLIVWDTNGQEGIFDLHIQNDTSELLETVNLIAPNEAIKTRITDDSFIISGQLSNTIVLEEIKKAASAYGFRDDKFVDLTDTPSPQVLLEVRIAEASKSVGSILKTSFSQQNGNLRLTRLASAPDSTIIGNLGRATAGIVPAAPIHILQSASNIGGVTGTAQFADNWRGVWDLLETNGKINTLANPSLVCTHGRTASFLAGGEFPFVGSVDQNGSPIIQFKEFGVKLNFTPWISMRSKRIEIKVQPEVSNLDSSNCVSTSGSPVCGILKRSTDTTVELTDGETLMISGILSREEQNNYSMVPFIHKVPILGSLFKNGQMSRNDRELVVIITPHIMEVKKPGQS